MGAGGGAGWVEQTRLEGGITGLYRCRPLARLYIHVVSERRGGKETGLYLYRLVHIIPARSAV